MKIFGRSIFRWSKPTVKYAVGVFVIAFLAFVVVECAEGAEVGAGFSMDSGIGVPEGFAVEVREDWRNLRFGAGFAEEVYIGALYVASPKAVSFWNVQPWIGLGGQLNTEGYYSTVFNFRLELGFRVGEKWNVEIKHASNAGLDDDNPGLNWILVSRRL